MVTVLTDVKNSMREGDLSRTALGKILTDTHNRTCNDYSRLSTLITDNPYANSSVVVTKLPTELNNVVLSKRREVMLVTALSVVFNFDVNGNTANRMSSVVFQLTHHDDGGVQSIVALVDASCTFVADDTAVAAIRAAVGITLRDKLAAQDIDWSTITVQQYSTTKNTPVMVSIWPNFFNSLCGGSRMYKQLSPPILMNPDNMPSVLNRIVQHLCHYATKETYMKFVHKCRTDLAEVTCHAGPLFEDVIMKMTYTTEKDIVHRNTDNDSDGEVTDDEVETKLPTVSSSAAAVNSVVDMAAAAAAAMAAAVSSIPLPDSESDSDDGALSDSDDDDNDDDMEDNVVTIVSTTKVDAFLNNTMNGGKKPMSSSAVFDIIDNMATETTDVTKKDAPDTSSSTNDNVINEDTDDEEADMRWYCDDNDDDYGFPKRTIAPQSRLLNACVENTDLDMNVPFDT